MDTSLMNLMYDDVFDGNYSVYNTYENTSEFWTSNEGMQMQLAEALQGILPIPPTEEFHLDDDSGASVNLQEAKNSVKFDDLTEQHLGGVDGGAIIKTESVDPPASGYDTDGDDKVNCCGVADNDHDEGSGDNFDGDDQLSLYSEPIYGSHTDSSSSIGDYESHSSDYDDDTYCDNDRKQNLYADDHIVDIDSVPINGEPLVLKNKNNVGVSPKLDANDLDLNIDVQNFDLAEFITKEDEDDFPPLDYDGASSSNVKIQDSLENVVRVIPHNDSDSDIIVDVESLDPDEQPDDSNVRSPMQSILPQTEYIDMIPEDDTPYVDNVKDDPSWVPTPAASTLRKQNAASKELNRTTKKQLKANSGQKASNTVSKKLQLNCSKGKSSSKHSVAKAKVNKSLENKAIKEKASSQEKVTLENKESIKRIPSQNITGGVGGGRASSNKNQFTAERKVQEVQQQQSPLQTEIQPQKRKLNLEEYKNRLKERLQQNNSNNSVKDVTINEVSKCERNTQTITSPNKNNRTSQPQVVTPAKRSELVTSIVKCLKEKTKESKAVDPITEAKNKVLRMQELKKAQQLRLIDSTVSAKIPKVTKVLPLREIVKDTPYLGNEEEDKQMQDPIQIKSRPDYEEIIIVSASCNTEITIPPYKFQAENSLLKPYRLLSSINSTLQTVKTNENVKLSSNSLLSSIQGVVIKKSLPSLPLSNEMVTKPALPPNLTNEYSEEHGENKIIMHLPKNRERKSTNTVSVQTDVQAAFPPLTLIKIHLQHKPRERERTKRKKNSRKRSDSSSSSSIISHHSAHNQECDRLAKPVEYPASLVHHSPDGSYSSVDYRRTYDGAMPNGGYSSRSTRRHRSSVSSSYSECMANVSENRRQRRTSYKQRSKKRSLSPYEDSSSSSSCITDRKRSCSRDYKRSRSRSRIRSRSRSNSHSSMRNRNRNRRPRQRKGNDRRRRNKAPPIQAVEERRIVYVGRIEPETNKEKLLFKFSCYGTINNISMHHKEDGTKYGFLTFERSCDAFAVIDNATRDPKINMYDVSFGGRREFCRASYADLDNAGINTYESHVYPKPNHLVSEEKDTFESLLQKMKDKLNANKSNKKPLSSTNTKI